MRRARESRPVEGAPPLVLRDARPSDEEALLRLARILDSINLPTEVRELRAALRRSRRSFAGAIEDPSEGIYIFIAEEPSSGRALGSSMIIAKHGTPDSPHYYLDVQTEERYSRTLRKMFRHTYLRLRHSMDGPTEVGGLVVDPDARRHPEKLGTQLSFVRFLYMALHRERFGHDVIAEMKPPLTARGENLFWQCYGARVTGLTFHEADRLSTRDKEFISALFPDVPIYTCMLPVEVQEEIGKVGPDTVGAVHLLERIGLRFLNQIDPFDAGPYYGALVDDISLVRDLRRVRLVAERNGDTVRRTDFLIGVERRGFLAFRGTGRLVEDVLFLPAALLSSLRIRNDTLAGVIPFA
ncbi:MAG: arginine N-succinyltransferase [Candidatus Binatia bacterium]